jgi:ATP-dependent Clp protease ATP-binding subunit ClpX
MGFKAETKSKKERRIGELLPLVEPDDLLKFGLIPELIGRLPVISALDELGDDALMKILMEPRNAITKQYMRMFELEGVELEFEKGALDAIIAKSRKRGTGARGLRSIMEDSMLDIMYDLPSNRDVKKCIITRQVVEAKGDPIYEYRTVKKRAS